VRTLPRTASYRLPPRTHARGKPNVVVVVAAHCCRCSLAANVGKWDNNLASSNGRIGSATWRGQGQRKQHRNQHRQQPGQHREHAAPRISMAAEPPALGFTIAVAVAVAASVAIPTSTPQSPPPPPPPPPPTPKSTAATATATATAITNTTAATGPGPRANIVSRAESELSRHRQQRRSCHRRHRLAHRHPRRHARADALVF
jgi:hypothetical protein